MSKMSTNYRMKSKKINLELGKVAADGAAFLLGMGYYHKMNKKYTIAMHNYKDHYGDLRI